MTAAPHFSPANANALDRHFAGFVARFGGDERLLRSAAASLSRSVREGHICLTLDSIVADFDEVDSGEGAIPRRSLAEWKAALQESSAVGPPEAETPLVLDGADRLYLRRYWNYQAGLATAMRRKCSCNPPAG